MSDRTNSNPEKFSACRSDEIMELMLFEFSDLIHWWWQQVSRLQRREQLSSDEIEDLAQQVDEAGVHLDALRADIRACAAEAPSWETQIAYLAAVFVSSDARSWDGDAILSQGVQDVLEQWLHLRPRGAFETCIEDLLNLASRRWDLCRRDAEAKPSDDASMGPFFG